MSKVTKHKQELLTLKQKKVDEKNARIEIFNEMIANGETVREESGMRYEIIPEHYEDKITCNLEKIEEHYPDVYDDVCKTKEVRKKAKLTVEIISLDE